MPIYEFSDDETGISILLRRPVKERDKPIVLKRTKTVPDNINVLLPRTTQDMNFNQRIRKQFYGLEQKQGSRFLAGSNPPIKNKARLAELWKDQRHET